ncbi:2-hydroxychromene-2-carboxylate isomerase [Cupriavidus consociatus]|uniref:2-hydroxychromene-2-carboxylate isomerase n=1 Tax=Cupriavidus consociatus TaxID=2821357 RepID=UPI001AE8EF51|nr:MULTISPECIES: DsbA family protein [unclassified Cupriavidus]MBP0621162.1 DsbA family protein [Cupriavidus sp. LEh25]MDK2657832.1 DsbA family protein [Cupriavidus sp. LEh21]
MEKADWFFDVISPFGYLHFHSLAALDGRVDVQTIPVLLAGLLKHWDTKGPAEIPPKRLHTYQYCVWKAGELNLPFRMPPRHPFNSLNAQRLLVAAQADREVVSRAFDFVYGEGRDPELEFDAFAEHLGLNNAREIVGATAVKQQLLANTERAISLGAFGVPTLMVRGRLFWGSDTVEWTRAFLDDPKLFERPTYEDAARSEFGVARR